MWISQLTFCAGPGLCRYSLPAFLLGGWVGGAVIGWLCPASCLDLCCGSLTYADSSHSALFFLTISFTFFVLPHFCCCYALSHCIGTFFSPLVIFFFCIVYKLDCCEQCMIKLHPLTKNKQKKQEWAVVQCLWVSEFSVKCLCTLNTLSYIK